MKKLIYTICFLLLFSLPVFKALAFSESDMSVIKQYVSREELDQKKRIDIPVNFVLVGSQEDLKEVKLIKMLIEDTCVGQFGFKLKAGDIRPGPDDYKDGKIEGTFIYTAISDKFEGSCDGDHDVQFYFCRTTDACWLTSQRDNVIGGDPVTVKDVIRIGGEPFSEEPPDDDNPPAPGGEAGGYDPLLPGEGQFLTIWDLLARIVQILLALASIVAVGAIIIGGYQYMTSGGIPDKAQIAKATITYAIIGLILVMIFYVALRFFLPMIGVSRDVIWL